MTIRSMLATDLQAVVERHLGGKVDWFFNQWVYGTDIPTYEWSYRTERGQDGKPRLKLRVLQRDVPDDFVMPVPVRLEFAGGEAMFRVVVKGPKTEFETQLPAEPKRVVFNEFESVLADVKQAKWSN